MTVKDLIDSRLFELANEGEYLQSEITEPFCCDLLSIAMGKAPEGGAWVTVMANLNTLAVASLTDTACIILAHGVHFDEATQAKAAAEGITVFTTDMPVFDAALAVCKKLQV